MTAPAHGYSEPLVARQLHRINDIGHTAAARDERRPLVDEAVMNLPRDFVSGIGRTEELAGERSAKPGDRFGQG
jgi:hypothetical protein